MRELFSKNIFALYLFNQINLSKLRYFYIDEIDAYFVNRVDHDQKLAHHRVRYRR